ncbi:glutaminase [Nocardia sp. CA-107356]|uniref:glutaminase n=1 Tax=Nocardia sp. CA-107356 TaxID=3239972 RepID=UPI003D93D157
MTTCGTYDAAGEFADRIGLPCKSGVGGGSGVVAEESFARTSGFSVFRPHQLSTNRAGRTG